MRYNPTRCQKQTKKQAASAKSAGLKKEYFPTLRKNRKIGQRISLTSDNR